MDNFYVGIGEADITPARPAYLAGHASRSRRHKSRGITRPIKVQSLLLEQPSHGKKILLLVYDLLGFEKDGVIRIKNEVRHLHRRDSPNPPTPSLKSGYAKNSTNVEQ